MTNEERVRALLDATAQDHPVDEDRLWAGIEARLDTRASRPPRRFVPVAAAAAAALVIGGTAAWVSASTAPSPTPVGPAGAPTTTAPAATAPTTSTTAPTATAPRTTEPTSEPAPTRTSTPPPSSATPVPPSASVPAPPPALSKGSLLTAADYATVGWSVDAVSGGAGMGQAAISRCENDVFGQVDPVSVFSAQGYRAAGWAGQHVAEVPTGKARTLTDGILAWPSTCDQDKATGTLHRVKVPGADQASWYTIGYGPDQGEELVAVVRAGDRVSLVVLGTSGSDLADADADRLLALMAERLS